MSEPRRTDPRGFVLKAIEGMRSAFLPLAVVIFTRIDDGMQAVFLVSLIVGGGLAAISLLFAYLSWTRLTYRVDGSDILVESGLLSRQARSVPFERIQDVATTQGFLARLFGLVEITFDTGAGAGEDISLSYLREDEAERLRETIRDRRDEAETAGFAEDIAEPSRLLFAMPRRRVILFGVYNFSLVAIAAVGGFLAQYDDLLPFDIWDLDGWQQRLAGSGAWLAGLGVVAQAIGVVALLAFLALFGVATGIIRTALSQWNFRLERTEKGFRRRRGLFTRTDVTLPVRRVQAAIIGARMREKLTGWQGASLVSLAADAGASHHEIAPFARWEEIEPLIRESGLRVPEEHLEWHRVSHVHAFIWGIRRLCWWIAIALIAVAAQYFLELRGLLGSVWFPAVPLVIGLWECLRTIMSILRTRYALDDAQLYVKSGWLAQTLELVPREKLHSMSVGYGPIGRRLGLASINVGVAGTQVSIDGVAWEKAYAMRGELLRSMQHRDFSQLN